MNSSVYLIRAGLTGPIKIGSAENPESRLATLQTGNPEDLYLLSHRPENEWVNERVLHDVFSPIRLRGEWFFAAPCLIEFSGILPELTYESFYRFRPRFTERSRVFRQAEVKSDSLKKINERSVDFEMLIPVLVEAIRRVIKREQSDIGREIKKVLLKEVSPQQFIRDWYKSEKYTKYVEEQFEPIFWGAGGHIVRQSINESCVENNGKVAADLARIYRHVCNRCISEFIRYHCAKQTSHLLNIFELNAMIFDDTIPEEIERYFLQWHRNLRDDRSCILGLAKSEMRHLFTKTVDEFGRYFNNDLERNVA